MNKLQFYSLMFMPYPFIPPAEELPSTWVNLPNSYYDPKVGHAAYNRYLAGASGAATRRDVVFTWSGVRALHNDEAARPSAVSRSAALSFTANGAGGYVTLYGGKLTTHRALAETVLDRLASLGARVGAPWTKGATLYGGGLSRAELMVRAERGPASLSQATRRRLALTYGDRIETLFACIAGDPGAAAEIAPGVTHAELEHAVGTEDAMTAEDFLLRRTKLHLTLDAEQRAAIGGWFATAL